MTGPGQPPSRGARVVLALVLAGLLFRPLPLLADDRRAEEAPDGDNPVVSLLLLPFNLLVRLASVFDGGDEEDRDERVSEEKR